MITDGHCKQAILEFVLLFSPLPGLWIGSLGGFGHKFGISPSVSGAEHCEWPCRFSAGKGANAVSTLDENLMVG
jgi:hypothetical protein